MGMQFGDLARLSLLATLFAWGGTSRAASSDFFVLDLRQIQDGGASTTICRMAFSGTFTLDLRQLTDMQGESVAQAASSGFVLDLRSVTPVGDDTLSVAFCNAFVLNLRTVKDETSDIHDPEEEVRPESIESSSFAFELDLTQVADPVTAYSSSSGFALDLRYLADQSVSDTSAWSIAASGTFPLDLRGVIGVASGNSVVLASSGVFELDLRKITVEGVIVLPEDITGGKAIKISEDWVNKDLDTRFGAGRGIKFGKMYGYDLKQALTKPTGKHDVKGNELLVWHDYVAGTDPTDEKSVFQAKVEIVDGQPKVTWEPALNGEGVQTGIRTYRVFGTRSLGGTWEEVDGNDSNFNFFKVVVELP